MSLFWAVSLTAILIAGIYGVGLAVTTCIRRLGRSSEPPPAAYMVFALGVTTYVAVAGLLLAIGVADRSAILAIGGIGLIGSAIGLVRSTRRGSLTLHNVAFGLVILALIAAAVILSYSYLWNPCDDQSAYSYLVSRLLHTGELIDPFDQRRVVVMGAGTTLQALGPAILTDRYLILADVALGGALIAWVAAGFKPTRGRAWLALAVGGIFALSPTLTGAITNSSLRVLPAALFAAALRLFYDYSHDRLAALTGGVLFGAIACTLLAIRPTFVPPLLLVAFLMLFVRGAIVRCRQFYFGAIAAGMFVLLGYSIALYRSSLTPLFPLLTGTFDPTFPTESSPLSISGFIAAAVSMFTFDIWIWTALLVVSVIVCIVARTTEERLLFAFALIAAISSPLIALALLPGASTSPATLSHFFTPPVAGVLIFMVAALADTITTRRSEQSTGVTSHGLNLAAGVAALAVFVAYAWGPTSASSVNDVILHNVGAPGLLSDRFTANVAEYERLSRAIPPGAGVLAAVDIPGLLNFDRMKISTLDQPGAASIPPYIPLLGSPKMTLDYLADKGIDFVVAASPSSRSCLYSRKSWEYNLTQTDTVYSKWAPYARGWGAFVSWSVDNYTGRGVQTVGQFVVISVNQVEEQARLASNSRASGSTNAPAR